MQPPYGVLTRSRRGLLPPEYASFVAFGLSAQERLRFAVLSPHLDDGVLSLGAAIAAAVTGGNDVTVLTIFAGDPRSAEPAGDWDRRAGFPTAREAVERRREEDRRACEFLGARAAWLPFGDEQYAGERDEDEIWSRVAEAIDAVDAVLVPGRPLIHPDHLWIARLASGRDLRPKKVGFYAELPYDLWANAEKRRNTLRSRPETPRSWVAPRASLRMRLAKWKACGAYTSQLRWLGQGLTFRRALLRSRIGGERVAWQGERG
jgi:LmbE family N-acetylglucosaminyl deacetylase